MPRGKKSVEIIDMMPLKEKRVCFIVRGDAPYVGNRMPKKEHDKLIRGMERPNEKTRKREPKDFDGQYKGAIRISDEGTYGIPSSGIQQALVDASRSVDIPMTVTKQSLVVEPEGFDMEDGMGLCIITKGKPSKFISRVTNADGSIDFRARPRWKPGWEARIVIRWNDSKMSINTITTLLVHATRYIGFGAGRPFSKKSSGCGWGTSEVIKTVQITKKAKRAA
jgi:hypothetical protein